MSRCEPGISIAISLNDSAKMNERNSFIFVQNFREFQCIFESFHFASRRLYFSEKIWFWRKGRKFGDFRVNFERISRFSRKFKTNFAIFFWRKLSRKWTKIFVFVHIFVGGTNFSRKRLNENLENLFHNCPILPISIPTNVTFSVVQNSDNYPDGTIAIHQVPGCDIILIFDKGIES